MASQRQLIFDEETTLYEIYQGCGLFAHDYSELRAFGRRLGWQTGFGRYSQYSTTLSFKGLCHGNHGDAFVYSC